MIPDRDIHTVLADAERRRDERITELEAERDRLEYALQTLRLNPLDHPGWPMCEQLIDDALNKASAK